MQIIFDKIISASLNAKGAVKQEAHGPHRSPEKNSSNQLTHIILS